MSGRSIIGVQSEDTLSAMIDKAANKPPADGTPKPDDAPLEASIAAAILASPTAATGAPAAPLTIVEFTDFQCPFCRAAVAPMEQLLADRGRQIRWVFRAFPLDFHPEAEIAAEAALAAREQVKFWPMHDLLFAHQSSLKIDNLRAYAKELNLDMNQFDQALVTHKFAGQIAADRALGVKAGVNGTPTFFVDGQAFSGVRTLAELNQIADSHSTPVSGKPAGLGAIALTETIVPDQQVLGPAARVPLTLTWFVDVRSPLAARQAELIHRLATQYDGKIRVLFRAFTLDSHPDSSLAGAALIAALKQDKFWPMYDALAARRDTLDRDKLLAVADALQIDRTVFSATLDDATAVVALDINDAARRGIQGAPVLFLNQQRVDGLQSDQSYTAILDTQLRTAPAVQANLQKR